MSTKKRSLAKSLTWRIIAILSTFGVGYILSGSVAFAAGLSFLSNLINFVLYYVHERVWLRVDWGKSND
jgi:uncharacterized membrane protein